MGAPFLPDRTVEDAAIDLIRGVQAFNNYRADTERMTAELEARWAANRAARVAKWAPEGELRSASNKQLHVLSGN